MMDNHHKAEDEARIIHAYRSLVASGRPFRLEVAVNRRGRLAALDVVQRETKVFRDRNGEPVTSVDNA